MVRSIISDSVVLFLLIYALLDIMTQLAAGLSARLLKRRGARAYRLLFLGAEEACVEETVRRTVREAGRDCPGVIAIDLGMPEEARGVAEKLCAEYACFRLLQKEQLLPFVERQTALRRKETGKTR